MATTRNGSLFKSEAAKYFYWFLAAMAGSQGLNTVTVSDQDRHTGKMQAEYAKYVEEKFEKVEDQQNKDRDMLKEYSDTNRELTVRDLKIYATEKFLPKSTRIPPPEVESRLDRLEDGHDRHEDEIDRLRARVSECCHNRTTEFNALEAK